MSGMGELWRSLGRKLPVSARVIGVDLSPEMAHRARREQPFSVEVLITDVLTWEPHSGLADAIVSSFGLKTFDREQQQQLARKVAYLLKPGGSYSFVEISVPPSSLLRAAFMFYLKRMIPLIGRLLLGDPACYRMLGTYTEAFGDTTHFVDCLREAGLEVAPVAFFFGCATGARGGKPVGNTGIGG